MTGKEFGIDSEKLLISGVTGFIGFKTLTDALSIGYHVRGIVRSDRNISELQSKSSLISKAYENGQLEFVVVPDFLDKEAISKVLQEITTVIHLASPLAAESNDYQANIIEPAIAMVTTILEAAMQVKTIQRIVITSSCVTLVPFEWNFDPNSEKLYTVSDINSNPKTPFQSAMEAYWASKALARLATKKFVEQHKPHWDYVNLLPSVVIGPDERISLTTGKTTELVKETRAAVLAPVLDASFNSPFPFVGVPVHVSDVAKAHIDAVHRSKVPGNSEFILCSDTPEGVTWDSDIRSAAQKYFANDVENGILPMKGSLQTIKWRLDGMTTEKTFGWKFISFEQTAKDMIGQYIELKKND